EVAGPGAGEEFVVAWPADEEVGARPADEDRIAVARLRRAGDGRLVLKRLRAAVPKKIDLTDRLGELLIQARQTAAGMIHAHIDLMIRQLRHDDHIPRTAPINRENMRSGTVDDRIRPKLAAFQTFAIERTPHLLHVRPPCHAGMIEILRVL